MKQIYAERDTTESQQNDMATYEEYQNKLEEQTYISNQARQKVIEKEIEMSQKNNKFEAKFNQLNVEIFRLKKKNEALEIARINNEESKIFRC